MLAYPGMWHAIGLNHCMMVVPELTAHRVLASSAVVHRNGPYDYEVTSACIGDRRLSRTLSVACCSVRLPYLAVRTVMSHGTCHVMT